MTSSRRQEKVKILQLTFRCQTMVGLRCCSLSQGIKKQKRKHTDADWIGEGAEAVWKHPYLYPSYQSIPHSTDRTASIESHPAGNWWQVDFEISNNSIFVFGNKILIVKVPKLLATVLLFNFKIYSFMQRRWYRRPLA